ncbi:MAG: MotA/TolQ/ExbB proton channel family protein [Gammaproteobacteria bacterium]
MTGRNKINSIIICFVSMFISTMVCAEAPKTLDELLKMVREESTLEKKANIEREEVFKQAKDDQEQLLKEALAVFEKEDKRGTNLRRTYSLYENQIGKQTELLESRAGSLRELHGVVRQIAGDVDAVIDTSFVSAQKTDRVNITDALASSKKLPEIKELEQLWLLVLDEIVESGKVVRFNTGFINSNGEEVNQPVTRIGTFNAISNGRFLRYLPDSKKLVEPPRQPSNRFQSMAIDLEQSQSGVMPFPLDPTRGAMLALLVQTPDLKTRVKQGGIVGMIIIFLALTGVIIALERFYILSGIDRKVIAQMKNKNPGENPLGRIMKIYLDSPDINSETLGLKLDEAILKEMPQLRRGLGILALLAAVAPLLGLLGTVTGIIETFQSITLFGTGDPRVMSGGISQALVTTVMGLVAAIPLLLLHSFLSTKSNRLIHILDENSAAFVAQLAESRKS